MKPTVDTYPIFEANQVLTNHHLNDVFNYLDEQERLSRANLIGIGIVCGLEIDINAAGTQIQLSRGCGITSQGYLIIEPLDVTLVSYRPDYKIPLEIDYPPFKIGGTQVPLWELFPTGEPNTNPLGDVPNFLADKVVVLFLELKKDDLGNCSPNNCDDKGAEVVGTVRRLLMRVPDAAAIVAAGGNLGNGMSQADITASIEARLNLPDLRLPRYDVPATKPVTSEDVLSAFFHVFQQNDVVANMKTALFASYQAYKPLLKDDFPTNPFTNFLSQFQFLDNGLTDEDQVLFLQYYYDLFDDVIKAYDEFRWKGVELMCMCCPPDGLFPRHLILGPQYRNNFLASGALSGCESLIEELVLLFKRLVNILSKFTNAPQLPAQPPKSKTDGQIRITPSALANVPLSEKAIPYYYDHDGTPPIRELWNPELTERNRANQNLSYWASHYSPVAPAFVRNALAFDLEPYNFLRIEGHIGKNYVGVMSTLLTLKRQNRLPIEIIALRTGLFDESVPIDLSKEDCRFRDLETLYDALRDELQCSIRKVISRFARRSFTQNAFVGAKTGASAKTNVFTESASIGAVSSIDPVENFETEYSPVAGTVGGEIFSQMKTKGLDNISVSTDKAITNAVVNSVVLLYRFALVLSKDLFEVDWNKFDTLYAALKQWSTEIGAKRDQTDGDPDLSWRDLDNELISVIFACRLDAFKSLREEYARRIKEVKQKQYFSHFIAHNPGIQHKAGVPIGGTFIVVYHQEDETTTRPGANRFTASDADSIIANISSNQKLSGERSIQDLIGGVQRLRQNSPQAFDKAAAASNNVIQTVTDELENGTVIADFFVPYMCCSDCMPIQYIVQAPKTEPPATTPVTFTIARACTNSDSIAEATITASGGVPPYQVKINAAAAQPLTGPITLPVGTNTITVLDSAGNSSASLTETVPSQLKTDPPTFQDNVAQQTYTAAIKITGGTAPYTASKGTVAGDALTITNIKSNEAVIVEITDSKNCKTTAQFKHLVPAGCDKPCQGIAERCRYMLWMQKPIVEEKILYRAIGVAAITITDENKKAIPIPNVHEAISAILSPRLVIDVNNYDEIVMKIITTLNELVAKATSSDLLVFGYDPKMPGIITIEHYTCQTFAFQIRFTGSFTNIAREETWTYDEGGITVVQTIPGKETQKLPKFGCVNLDKCKNTSEPEPARSIVTVAMTSTANGNLLTPTFAPTVPSGKLFWRIDGSQTVTSTESTVVLPETIGSPVHVRIEVVGTKGAWSYGESVISKPGGTGGTGGGGRISPFRPGAERPTPTKKATKTATKTATKSSNKK